MADITHQELTRDGSKPPRSSKILRRLALLAGAAALIAFYVALFFIIKPQR